MTLTVASLRRLFTITFVALLATRATAEERQQQQRPVVVGGETAALKLHRQNVTIMAYNVNHLHYVFQVAFRPRNEGDRIERLNDALKKVGKTTGKVMAVCCCCCCFCRCCWFSAECRKTLAPKCPRSHLPFFQTRSSTECRMC